MNNCSQLHNITELANWEHFTHITLSCRNTGGKSWHGITMSTLVTEKRQEEPLRQREKGMAWRSNVEVELEGEQAGMYSAMQAVLKGRVLCR